MKHRTKIAAAGLSIVLALAAGSVAARGQLEADPGVQREIERVVTAIVDSGQTGDTAVMYERIGDLEQAAGGDRQVLLLQLTIYLADAAGTRGAMGGALALHHFEFSSGEIIAAIVPQLGTDEPRRRRVFHDLLSTVDRPESGEPDFEPYVAYLRDSDLAAPAHLVEYLYGVAAPEALSALAEVYLADPAERESIDRAARSAAGVLGSGSEPADDLPEQLDRLSQNGAWWIRFFVREFVAAAPGYATPELMGRLESDEHPLVRGGARR